MAPVPRVELLWWRECPSWERALAMLREAMEAVGLDPDSIEAHEVDTEKAAEREEFVGSPTIRVDGHDIQQPAEGEPTGLACRVYRRRDGRTSPLPDPEDLRDALRAAAVP
ncbi:MAG: thioredoxin family protein [Solirubrobacterales bacterium]